MKKEFIIVVAAAENNAMGLNGDLPWHLPDDFKHFKQTTSGHPIIMGRKTVESFPKPLPNRDHIVITKNSNYKPLFDVYKVCTSIEEALEAHPAAVQFIVGGGEIYRQALPLADKVILSRVHATIEADTYFPELDLQIWKKVSEHHHPVDEKHQYAFTIEYYERR